MRRGLLSLLGVAVVGGLLAVSGTAHTRGGGTPADAAFRLGDGSAACAFADGQLACRSAESRRAFVLAPDGSTSVEDTPVSWDEQTTVLRPTESWWHGGFACRVEAHRPACTKIRR